MVQGHFKYLGQKYGSSWFTKKNIGGDYSNFKVDIGAEDKGLEENLVRKSMVDGEIFEFISCFFERKCEWVMWVTNKQVPSFQQLSDMEEIHRSGS